MRYFSDITPLAKFLPLNLTSLRTTYVCQELNRSLHTASHLTANLTYNVEIVSELTNHPVFSKSPMLKQRLSKQTLCCNEFR